MQQVAVFTGFPGDETERAGGGWSPTPLPLPLPLPLPPRTDLLHYITSSHDTALFMNVI